MLFTSWWGIRNFETVEFLIKNKIDRVVLGTIALKNKKLCEQICKSFPGKIAVGIDAKKGWVATDGWAKTSKVKVSEMIKSYEGIRGLVLYLQILKKMVF